MKLGEIISQMTFKTNSELIDKQRVLNEFDYKIVRITLERDNHSVNVPIHTAEELSTIMGIDTNRGRVSSIQLENHMYQSIECKYL
jgi:hypothetical protein